MYQNAGVQGVRGFYSDQVSGTYHNQGYGGNLMDPTAGYYPAGQYEYEQGSWDQPQGAQEWIHHQQETSETAKRGSFWFRNEFAPQIFGFPVSSLAYGNAYQAIYVSSVTQPMSTTRWRSHQASILATHSTTDGMLYSSVAAHPEASPSALQAVYRCMYGISKTVPTSRQVVPNHAYKPPYGGLAVEVSMSPLAGGKQGHLGINSLLPLPQGYVASVSPSAVRIHSHGGLQLHDHDIEGMICGTLHPHSDQGVATHISVGGIPHGEKHTKHEVHCMDLWQGLRIVSSRSFKDVDSNRVGVTAMATSLERGSIVAGCSDGNIRLLDGSLRELATIKSHSGGVASIDVSQDGMLIATSGYVAVVSGRDTSVLYAFPDPTVLVYDIRYLGRGGIPHPFAGFQGGPRFLSFLPFIEGLPENRLLVGSGQSGGGLQVLVPFEAQNEKSTSFLIPTLDQGESISAMLLSEDNLALGTSSGRVLEYCISGYDTNTKASPTKGDVFVPSGSRSISVSSSTRSRFSRKNKQCLEMPAFLPPSPPVSLDPTLLQSNDANIRNGTSDKMKSLFTSYVLLADPTLTSIGNHAQDARPTFGSLGNMPVVASSRRTVVQNLISGAVSGHGDFMLSIPTSKLELDLLANHNPVPKRYKGGKSKEPIPNPNKLIYCSALSSSCYEDGLNGRKRSKGRTINSVSSRGPSFYFRFEVISDFLLG